MTDFAPNVKLAWDKLIAAGKTPYAAAGLIGGWMNESGRNLDPGAVGPSGDYGIAQDLGPRKTGLLSYLDKQGLSKVDPGGHIDYAINELNGPESLANKHLMAATNLRDATAGGVDFERPSTYAKTGPFGVPDFDKRLQSATQVYNAFATGGGISGIPPAQPLPAAATLPAVGQVAGSPAPATSGLLVDPASTPAAKQESKLDQIGDIAKSLENKQAIDQNTQPMQPLQDIALQTRLRLAQMARPVGLLGTT